MSSCQQIEEFVQVVQTVPQTPDATVAWESEESRICRRVSSLSQVDSDYEGMTVDAIYVVIKSLLKYSAVALAPTLLLAVPLWSIPRAFTTDIDYTATDFLASCEAGGGESEWERPGVATSLIVVSWTLSTAVFLLMYHAYKVEMFGDFEEEPEVAGRIQRTRWRFFVLWVIFVGGHGVLRIIWAGQPDQSYILWPGFAIFFMGLVCFSWSLIWQAKQLSNPWVTTTRAKASGIVCFVILLGGCQFMSTRAEGVLVSYGDLGILILIILSNLMQWFFKVWVMKSGIPPSFLTGMEMCVGAAVTLQIRLYVFLQPSVVAAITSSLFSGALNVGGYVINGVRFAWLRRMNWLPAKLPPCTACQMFGDILFEFTTLSCCLLVLLIADTYWLAPVGLPWGATLDASLVTINFVFAFLVQIFVSVGSVALIQKAMPTMNIPAAATHPGTGMAVLSFAFLFTAQNIYAVSIRNGCLRCGDPTQYLCFD